MGEYRQPVAFLLASITAAVAALTLVGGWLLGSQLLIRLNPSFPGMVPSTAISIILLSAPVAMSGWTSSFLRRAVAAAVGLLAVTNLVVIFAGYANGIDSLMLPDLALLQTNSMAPATALTILSGAFSLYLTTVQSALANRFFSISCGLGLLMAGTALIGYLFDAEALYNVSWFSAMALHTAACLVFLLSSILLSEPEVGWVSVLIGNDAGSRGARRLLPVVLVLPLIVCLAALMASEAGFFDANFRLSIVALVMIVLLAVCVFENAKVQNLAEHQTRTIMDDLRVTIEERDLLLREVYHRVKNNLQQINAMIALEMMNAGHSEAKSALASTAARVNALGHVHTLLVSSKRPSHLDVEEFLKSLVNNLVNAHSSEERKIRTKIEIDHDVISIDPAISIGLLANELVTNAVKHAFTIEKPGELTVMLKRQKDGTRKLIVRDNGVGSVSHANDILDGTGQRIIKALVSQLKATHSIEHDDGTVVTIEIPESVLKGESDV